MDEWEVNEGVRGELVGRRLGVTGGGGRERGGSDEARVVRLLVGRSTPRLLQGGKAKRCGALSVCLGLLMSKDEGRDCAHSEWSEVSQRDCIVELTSESKLG